LWNKRDGYNKWILKLQQQYGDVFEVWLSNKRKIYLCRAEYFDKLLSSSTKTKWSSPSRENVEPDELLGYQWPARSEFIMFFEGGNKNPQCWKDPEVFNPDRFMRDDKVVKSNFIFFGKGIRQCPGKKLAMIEMKGIIAMLFRKYDVTLINEELHYKSMIFNSIIEGVFIKITPRNDIILC
ncbi:21288_t:CDS:2, partial [Dentiscutata erythropus]